MNIPRRKFQQLVELVERSQGPKPRGGSLDLTVLQYFFTISSQLDLFHKLVTFRDYPPDRLYPGSLFTHLPDFSAAIASVQQGLYMIYGYDQWKGIHLLKNIGYSAPQGRRKIKDRIRDHVRGKSDLKEKVSAIDKIEIYVLNNVVVEDLFSTTEPQPEPEWLEEVLSLPEVLRAIEYVLVALLNPEYPDTSPLTLKARQWTSNHLVFRIVRAIIDQDLPPAFVFSRFSTD